MGLGRPAVGDGLALQVPALPRRRLTLELLPELLDLLLDSIPDCSGSRGELESYLLWDVAHLGNAVGRFLPGHANGPSQLGPQAGVVDG